MVREEARGSSGIGGEDQASAGQPLTLECAYDLFPRFQQVSLQPPGDSRDTRDTRDASSARASGRASPMAPEQPEDAGAAATHHALHGSSASLSYTSLLTKLTITCFMSLCGVIVCFSLTLFLLPVAGRSSPQPAMQDARLPPRQALSL